MTYSPPIVVEVAENQTLFDICLKYYGSLEGLAQLERNNPGVLNGVAAGQKLTISGEIIRLRTVEYFSGKRIITY